MFGGPDVEFNLQLESEFAAVGSVVRGTLTITSRKIIDFTKIVVAARVRHRRRP